MSHIDAVSADAPIKDYEAAIVTLSHFCESVRKFNIDVQITSIKLDRLLASDEKDPIETIESESVHRPVEQSVVQRPTAEDFLYPKRDFDDYAVNYSGKCIVSFVVDASQGFCFIVDVDR